MGKLGTIGLPAKEFKAIIEEVRDEAVEARQAAYDTVMEVLAFKETITPEEARSMLRQLFEAGVADQVAAANPKDYRQLLATALEGIS